MVQRGRGLSFDGGLDPYFSLEMACFGNSERHFLKIWETIYITIPTLNSGGTHPPPP